jgi:hypothetical protein
MVSSRVPEVAALPSIEVMTEEETGRGWLYRVRVTRPGAPPTEHEVRLSWADHEYWSGGAAAPSKVAEAVVRYCAAREHERPLPARFDAATARRWWPELDSELRL